VPAFRSMCFHCKARPSEMRAAVPSGSMTASDQLANSN
jgi:hypothetical protein